MPIDNRLIPSALAAQTAQLPAAWHAALQAPRVAAALQAVTDHVEKRLAQGAVIYPATPFRALHGLAPSDVRVVILGQDPYHGPGQAQGLAFSVPDDCKRPPSLRNIFNEIAQEYPGSPLPAGNDLTPWADQGVLLLNTALTVEDGQPASHAKRGWETVTDALIALVAQDPSPKVFMLWGAHAQAKQALLPHDSGHLVLMANHPSPLPLSFPPFPLSLSLSPPSLLPSLSPFPLSLSLPFPFPSLSLLPPSFPLFPLYLSFSHPSPSPLPPSPLTPSPLFPRTPFCSAGQPVPPKDK